MYHPHNIIVPQLTHHSERTYAMTVARNLYEIILKSVIPVALETRLLDLSKIYDMIDLDVV